MSFQESNEEAEQARHQRKTLPPNPTRQRIVWDSNKYFSDKPSWIRSPDSDWRHHKNNPNLISLRRNRFKIRNDDSSPPKDDCPRRIRSAVRSDKLSRFRPPEIARDFTRNFTRNFTRDFTRNGRFPRPIRHSSRKHSPIRRPRRDRTPPFIEKAKRREKDTIFYDLPENLSYNCDEKRKKPSLVMTRRTSESKRALSVEIPDDLEEIDRIEESMITLEPEVDPQTVDDEYDKAENEEQTTKSSSLPLNCQSTSQAADEEDQQEDEYLDDWSDETDDEKKVFMLDQRVQVSTFSVSPSKSDQIILSSKTLPSLPDDQTRGSSQQTINVVKVEPISLSTSHRKDGISAELAQQQCSSNNDNDFRELSHSAQVLEANLSTSFNSSIQQSSYFALYDKATCLHCGMHLTKTGPARLFQHLVTHASTRRFRCSECNTTNHKHSVFKQHLTRCHGETIDEMNPKMIEEWNGLIEKCYPQHMEKIYDYIKNKVLKANLVANQRLPSKTIKENAEPKTKRKRKSKDSNKAEKYLKQFVYPEDESSQMNDVETSERTLIPFEAVDLSMPQTPILRLEVGKDEDYNQRTVSPSNTPITSTLVKQNSELVVFNKHLSDENQLLREELKTLNRKMAKIERTLAAKCEEKIVSDALLEQREAELKVQQIQLWTLRAQLKAARMNENIPCVQLD